MRLLAAALAFASLAACTPRAVIPDSERQRVASDLAGQRLWLRVAVSVHPLFGDRTKLLLTDAPAGELDLLQSAGGEPLTPPPAERILAPGTPVLLREVEFATGWTIARRVVMTPRYHPWAILDVYRTRTRTEDVSDDARPHVIVLSQTAASYDDVRAELDRLLTSDDPTSLFQALPHEHRDAILRKELVEGMSPRAVEMAWGLPERKHIDRPTNREDWTWAGGKRKAFLQDERLVRWER